MAEDINIELTVLGIDPISVEFIKPDGIVVEIDLGVNNKPEAITVEMALMGPKGDKGDSGGVPKVDMFNPTNGQTVFTLSELPEPGVIVKMLVDGLRIYSFTRNGVTVTYTGTSYTLTTTDLVEFNY